MNMPFNPALVKPLVAVLSCTEGNASLCMGSAVFNIEHSTTTEWYDAETPDGYSTGKRDVEANTRIHKVILFCDVGIEIDMTSSFDGENQNWEREFTTAIEAEMERQARNSSDADNDLDVDLLLTPEQGYTAPACPDFNLLQSRKN